MLSELLHFLCQVVVPNLAAFFTFCCLGTRLSMDYRRVELQPIPRQVNRHFHFVAPGL